MRLENRFMPFMSLSEEYLMDCGSLEDKVLYVIFQKVFFSRCEETIMSNEIIANEVGRSERAVSRSIGKLKKKGYLHVKIKTVRNRTKATKVRTMSLRKLPFKTGKR